MTVEKSKMNRTFLYHNLAEYKMTNTLTTKIIDYRDTFVNINESYSSKRVLSSRVCFRASVISHVDISSP